MCFDLDSRPPALPPDLVRMAGGASAEVRELTSADGTEFSVALARAPEPVGTAVVVLPDVRGLHRFYIELAERFAEAGHSAIAIDYFGRTAGTGERGEEFEYMPHVRQTSVDSIQEDIAAAMAELGAERVATVGFCFGGSQSFYAGENPELGLDRVVGFYGGLGERPGRPAGKDEAAKMTVPVLALFGGADQSIPPEDRDVFARNLGAAGVEHEIHVYPDAPHSFFDRKQEEFAQESQDAWRRILAFLQ
jgi:carboxymethylenebutenolidase